jgi:prepilin-type N-terminal cleavage/methylation domain-containing protein|nr:prepilin-type N-terminal cleavage/methylation domain-containing protein [Candidatus Krumholzibacteria bacterium]
MTNRKGFTLIEIVIAVAIVAVFAAAISPMVFRHLEDAKVSKAQNETETIASAILSYYKDVGKWPVTSANGPSGNGISRVVSSTKVATGAGTGAASGATNWGAYGTAKDLGDYLYYNNPDDDSSATGSGADQNGQDWPTTGPNAWRGPYLDSYEILDPWGNAYVVNSRYFPGGNYTGSVRHRVFVLSAGSNGVWETGFADAATEEIQGDDIGTVVTIR